MVLALAAANLPAAEQHTAIWTGGNSFKSYSGSTNWDRGAVPINNPGTNYVVLVNANDSLVFDRPGSSAVGSLNLAAGTRLRLAGGVDFRVQNAAFLGGLLEALNTNSIFRAQAFGTTFGPQARVLAANGSQVTISGTPGSRYDWTSHYGDPVVFSAAGANSLLSLPDLGVLSMNGWYFDQPKVVEAVEGATLDLSGLTTATGARLDGQRLTFRVRDGGAMLLPQLRNVDGLTGFRMDTPIFTMPALQSAQNTLLEVPTNRTLRLPNLNIMSGSGTILDVKPGGRLEATNLVSFSDGYALLAPGGTVAAPFLTTFQNSRLELAPGMNWNVAPFQHIDNSRFSVTGGATFAIAATSYDWTYDYGENPLFTATGTNSLLDFKTIERLSMNQRYFNQQKAILALDYGKIDLSGTRRIVGARDDAVPLLVRIDSGGSINLASLQENYGRTRYQVDSGVFSFPAFARATNAEFVAGAGTTVNLPALRSLVGANSAINIAFAASNHAPSLVEMSDTAIDIAVAGTLNAPQLRSFVNSTLALSPGKTFISSAITNIDHSRIEVAGSNTLAIAAQGYNWTTHYGRAGVFTAEGDGCVLNLSSLRQMNFNEMYFDSAQAKLTLARVNGRMNLSNLDEIIGARGDSYPVPFRAESGGRIEFGDTVVTRGKVSFSASGETSMLKARSLLLPASATLKLELGGQLELSRGFTFKNTAEADVNMDAGAIRFVGGGAKYLEVGGTDAGAGGAAIGNFGCARLSIGTDGQRSVLRLVDGVNNGNRVASGGEALYLLGDAFGRSLDIQSGSVLVLNGLNAYAFMGGQMVSLRGLIPSGTNSVAFDGGFIADFGGPRITKMTPSVAVRPAVPSVEVTFAQPIRAATFTTADVSISGPGGAIAPTGVSLVSGTTWRITFASQSADGVYTVRVGPAIDELAANLHGMDQNGDGLSGDGANDTFTGTFIIDGAGPAVTSAYALQNGTRVGIALNEEIFGATVTNPANYVVNGAAAQALEWIPGGYGLTREVFSGIGGTALGDLTNAPAFPANPSSSNLVTEYFEAPWDIGDNYGQRLHGWLLPPVTGDYVFWIASDDAGALYLSTDETPANQAVVCFLGGAVGRRAWTAQSAPVRLEAGRRYYVSALQKEGAGGDHLAVRWLRPDGVDQGPIPSQYLLPVGGEPRPPRVVLTVPGLVGESFSLVISNMVDALGNTSTRAFTGALLPLQTCIFGTPGSDPREPGSSTTFGPGSFIERVGGSGMWYSSDSGRLTYEARTGDFDVRVRLESLGRVGSWTQAGIMARESTNSNSRHVFAEVEYGTAYNRYIAVYRATTGGSAAYWPGGDYSSVVPVPDAWMRLRRQGDAFIAFRGTNGVDWVEYARITNALPATLLVGMATSANNNGAGGATTAIYQDYGDLSPSILSQPASQSVVSGANVLFAVVARGQEPLSYQWQFNGVALPGQTGSSLTLASVTPARVGSYRVVVSNSYGSVTTQEAQLLVDGLGLGGFEADLSPAPLGNNVVTVSDFVKVGRLVAGLDAPLNSSEFARADCAPRTNAVSGTLPLGDGRLSVADWTQAGRYAAGVDALTAAGGPTSPGPLAVKKSLENEGPQAREVRMGSIKAVAGQTFDVPITLSSPGGENALGFSVKFDPERLVCMGASLAQGAASAHLQVNVRQASQGLVGIVLAMPAGQAFAEGALQLARIQFQALSTGNCAVSFGDSPVWREVADVEANARPAAYLPGSARIVAPGRLAPEVKYNGNRVELRLAGEPGERYRVEVSPDLVHWSAVSEVRVQSAAGTVSVLDEAAGGARQRFYRAVLIP